MKRIDNFWAAILLALTISLTSCSLLDVEADNILGSENFYQNEDDLIYGLTGIYGVINSEAMYGNYYSLMLSGVDDLCYQNRNPDSAQPYWYSHTASDTQIYLTWSKLYEGIKNANAYLEAISGSSINNADEYYAEARFLRAYYHFILAQAWGDVPMRKESASSPADSQIAATAQAEVLAWCAAEMEATLEDHFTSFDLDNAPSRVTRSAVKGILARVYMFTAGQSVEGVDNKTELWRAAAQHTYDIIASGKHKLNESYSQVFINMIGDTYEPQESIWEAEFMGNHAAGSWSNGRIGDLNGLMSNASDNFSQWASNYSYGWYNGSLKLWRLYSSSDARREWNLPPYNYNGGTISSVTYDKSYDKTPYSYNGTNTFDSPEVGGAMRNTGKYRREVQYEGVMNAKELYTGINYPILRYADVLLMYAEAALEAGESISGYEPYDAVKAVHNRSNPDGMPAKGEIDDLGEMIRDERGRELAFESLRKYDLIRWGIFVESMKSSYVDDTQDVDWKYNGTSTYASSTGGNVQDKHIVLPIPTIELGVNPLLEQHPLWR